MRKLFYFSNLLTLCLVLCATAGRAQAPVITTGPANVTTCEGTTTMFTVMLAADTIPAHYVWEVSADGTTRDTVTDGGLYTGAMSDTLMVTAAFSLNGDMYRVTAINDSGSSAVSDSAMLTVNPLPLAVPVSGASNVCAGSTTTLTAAGTGTWSSSNANATVDASGVVTAVSAGLDTIKYTISNSCGDAVSAHVIMVDTLLMAMPNAGPLTVCIAGTIHFTNISTGGVWTVSNGNATITTGGFATGVTPGIDTAIYIVNNSCNSDTSTNSFTVEAPLSTGTITGPSVVCVGSLVPYMASATGGFWLSSDGSIATVDASGNVTGRGQGFAIISYTQSNACGSVSAVDTIEVERTASAITGIDSVGIGATRVLGDSATNGSWSSSDPTIAGVDSATGIVTGVEAGTATITYMVTNTCGTSWATIVIHVAGLPAAGTITGSDSVCAHTSSLFTVSVPGGVWSVSNGNASINDTGLLTGLVGRTRDTVIYTVTNAFGTSSVRKAVYINDTLHVTITGPTSISLGSAYTVSATPAGGVWHASNTHATFINPAGGVFVVTVGGDVDLIYTISNACGVTRDTFAISLPGGGTDTSSAVNNVTGVVNALNVYPNPNNGTFTFNLTAADNETANVIVTNITGQVVKEFTAAANKATTVLIDQPAGVYFLNAATATRNYSTKITIAK